MAVSLKDVAQHAGVSAMTVSNVITGRVNVAAGTRERVQRAIAELGYRPNPSARSLAGGRTGVVAFAVPEIGIPYFAELARHVIDAAEERGWTLLIEQTDGRADREAELLTGIRAHLIDGMIIFPSALSTAEIATRAGATPLVLFGGQPASGPPVADHVVIDAFAAGRTATEHLISLGRRRIAVIGPLTEHRGDLTNARFDGYREALSAAGLPYDDGLVEHAPAYHRADGARAMARLLDRRDPPDAVFCFSDLLAGGALHTALSSGVRIPDGLAIAGFDDIEEGRFLTPTLTSVRPNKRRIAELVIERLATRLAADEAYEPEIVYADYELIRRQSTLGPAAAPVTPS